MITPLEIRINRRRTLAGFRAKEAKEKGHGAEHYYQMGKEDALEEIGELIASYQKALAEGRENY